MLPGTAHPPQLIRSLHPRCRVAGNSVPVTHAPEYYSRPKRSRSERRSGERTLTSSRHCSFTSVPLDAGLA